jgi:threonine synthase
MRQVVTIGEGGTRLLRATRLAETIGLQNLYLKDESRNPTGSFKDRKATVAVTKAKEFGFKTVASATAGNAGASVAAYAAKAGLRAVILAFKNVTRTKLAKLVAYGADVFIVEGDSSDVNRLAVEACKKYGWCNIVASSRYNPYVKDGAKTQAIEICEQLKWKAPDWLVVPAGNACGLASCWKGLKEIQRLGLIDNLPKMVGIQGTGCAPLVYAFEAGLPPEKIERFPNAHTIAHSIEDDYPPDGEQALKAIRESGGFAIGVEDDHMLWAQRLIAQKEGLFIEPASAGTVAAAHQLLDAGHLDPEDVIAAVATGFGLNEPESIFQTTAQTVTIEPRLESLENALYASEKKENVPLPP